MFENIIGHAGTVRTLKEELQSGSFPAATLLYGPQFSAKLSTALEIARVLTCSEEGRWGCDCSSCKKQRLLVHPNVLLLGSRYFDLEIAAAADVLLRVQQPSSRYLFIRALRKLTRRFDPVVWEGEESRIRGLAPALSEIEERLDALAPADGEGAGMAGRTLEQHVARVVSLSRALSEQLSSDNVPINHLRRAASWLHRTALSEGGSGADRGRKIVILENADGMSDNSGNSLLKLLEEPPAGAFLLLVTTRRSALMSTVASRLRHYLFAERPQGEEAQVLKRIFQETGEGYESLRAYFLYWQEVNPDRLAALARRFVEASLPESREQQAGEAVLAEIDEHLDRKRGRAFAVSFLEELLRQLRPLLREEGVDVFRLRCWSAAIRRHREALEVYNQHPRLTLESLFYTLKECA
jgi:DNA polymerase III delta prime subunit